MKPTIFIDGDQGTTGLQIMSRLGARDDLNLDRVLIVERYGLT
jgi:N-acetyl-gamma-glutamylphosphate reductase